MIVNYLNCQSLTWKSQKKNLVAPVEDVDKVRVLELFEAPDFEDNDPLRIATTAVLTQIKSVIEDSAYKGKFTVKALLNKLADNGVKMSHAQLIELVKEEPWSNLISNITGDKVMFKGGPDEYSGSEEPDDTSSTMDRMAKRAAKKQEM
jgi:hypothetical protein